MRSWGDECACGASTAGRCASREARIPDGRSRFPRQGTAHDATPAEVLARAGERGRGILGRAGLATWRRQPTSAARVLPALGAILEAERQSRISRGAEPAATRRSTSSTRSARSWGSTVRLEEATRTIVREVSTVVGARRASIMVHDEAAGVLRTVAARGFGLEGLAPVSRGSALDRGAGLPGAAGHRARPGGAG